MTIDHVTIRTTNLESTKTFFLKVFDLEEKPRPKIIQRIPGHWLYNRNNQPIVHLIQSRGISNDFKANTIDHIGFKLENYPVFRAKLDALNIPYSLMDIEELNERRIFLKTPGGVLLETVFNETLK